MENKNINNDDLPKEIKADNENINPLLDIISTIQEKLDNSNKNNNANNANIKNTTYTNNTTNNIPNFNFSNNTNNGFNMSNTNNMNNSSGFDTAKLFEMLGSMGSSTQKTTSSASNPFMNLDMDTMMRLGKIFTSMNKEDPRKNLLLSLKPFLRNDRQRNVDTYIFVLGILNVLDSFNNGDSGF